jgi:hypothetical protein
LAAPAQARSAPSAQRPDRPLRDQKKGQRGRRVGDAFEIRGGVVASGAMKPTRFHPLASLIPDERERAARRALGELVLKLTRRPS